MAGREADGQGWGGSAWRRKRFPGRGAGRGPRPRSGPHPGGSRRTRPRRCGRRGPSGRSMSRSASATATRIASPSAGTPLLEVVDVQAAHRQPVAVPVSPGPPRAPAFSCRASRLPSPVRGVDAQRGAARRARKPCHFRSRPPYGRRSPPAAEKSLPRDRRILAEAEDGQESRGARGPFSSGIAIRRPDRRLTCPVDRVVVGDADGSNAAPRPEAHRRRRRVVVLPPRRSARAPRAAERGHPPSTAIVTVAPATPWSAAAAFGAAGEKPRRGRAPCPSDPHEPCSEGRLSRIPLQPWPQARRRACPFPPRRSRGGPSSSR